jgi:hypothetical protein
LDTDAEALAVTEADLRHWRLLADFKNRLRQAARKYQPAPTWSDPRRELGLDDYLCLFLTGLMNPSIRTMRALCAASRLKRVQAEICSRPVSLGSFSEAQGVLDPQLLEHVFSQLAQETQSSPWPASTPGRGGAAGYHWHIQDGSLFEALPRMYWAFWRRQGKTDQYEVRLHLSLDLESDSPARATITSGKKCERAQWRTQIRRGDGWIGDRYYGQNYQLLAEISQVAAVLVRLREEAAITVEEELPLSLADQQAKVIRSAWVKLGSPGRQPDQRFRVVWVEGPGEVLVLVTNLKVEELSAAEVALLYKKRWQIELFFRWIKCILGCRHWLAESPQGVAIEIYLALIAALLLQLYSGCRPNKRMMELIQLYLAGVATLEELCAGVQREKAKLAKSKKS